MNPLVNEFDPPAPVISVVLQNPSHPEIRLRLRGFIDTGADVSAIPSSVVRTVALRAHTSMRISGVVGEEETHPMYIVDLEFAETHLERKSVIAWDGDLVILGRDVLDEFIFTYDGKARQFEIHDP